VRINIAWWLVFAAAGLFCAAIVLWVFDPSQCVFYPRCPFYLLTGFQCAGCGTLRAAHSLLHGEWLRAFAFNPLLFFSVPAIVVLFFRPDWARKPVVGWIAVAVVFLYSIIRNFTGGGGV
jgi:hypothetical protein